MIAKLSPNDYQRIIEIWESAVRATHHFLAEDDILFYKELIYRQYLSLVDLFGYYNDEGVLLGFVGIHKKNVQLLFIDASVRGCGIGKQLIQFAIKKRKIRYVDVNEQNQQALGFYEHMGFVTIDRFLTDDAGKPYPILRMQLRRKWLWGLFKMGLPKKSSSRP